MDKLTDEEQLRSDMMLETVHEVFAGMVMPAFMTIIEFHQQNIRGEIGDGECTLMWSFSILRVQSHVAPTSFWNALSYSPFQFLECSLI